MTSLLDDAETREAMIPVSVEFYHEAARAGMIGEDTELLDGIILKKMSNSPLHETVVRRLWRVLGPLAAKAGCFVMKEAPLTLSRSEPEPDLAVVQGDEEEFMRKHPSTALLVVQVAINTLPRDRAKAAIYAEAGISEYWLAEPETGGVTVFSHPLPERREYADAVTFAGGAVAQSRVLPGFSVTPAELFAVKR